MSRIIFSLTCVLSLSAACTSGYQTFPGEGPVKTAPSPTTPRLFDCMGENQTSKGNTRPDCLPNQGDAAERDTEAGAGGVEIRP